MPRIRYSDSGTPAWRSASSSSIRFILGLSRSVHGRHVLVHDQPLGVGMLTRRQFSREVPVVKAVLDAPARLAEPGCDRPAVHSERFQHLEDMIVVGIPGF